MKKACEHRDRLEWRDVAEWDHKKFKETTDATLGASRTETIPTPLIGDLQPLELRQKKQLLLSVPKSVTIFLVAKGNKYTIFNYIFLNEVSLFFWCH